MLALPVVVLLRGLGCLKTAILSIGFRGHNDCLIDLRMGDHPEPVEDLRPILHVRLVDPVWPAKEWPRGGAS